MTKLCVHIYTKYSNATSNNGHASRWNGEVKTDRETVKSVFKNDTVVEIKVPAQASKKTKFEPAPYLEALKEVELTDYNECHIVLNTHGAAGVNDLSDEVVKGVIRAVSNKGIKITQISALQCNGLKGLTESEYRSKYPMTPTHQHIVDKPSSLAILQGKLASLETAREQSFSIHGFMTAYDPIEDRAEIEKLLINGSRKSLEVTTRLSNDDELQNLSQYIATCSSSKDKKSPEYIKATNELGKLLHKMKQNICAYLAKEATLDERNMDLMQAVLADSLTDDCSATEFERKYKQWLKANRMSSEARLAVFKAYSPTELLSKEEQKLDNSASALCTGDLGIFKLNAASKTTAPVPLEMNNSMIRT